MFSVRRFAQLLWIGVLLTAASVSAQVFRPTPVPLPPPLPPVPPISQNQTPSLTPSLTPLSGSPSVQLNPMWTPTAAPSVAASEAATSYGSYEPEAPTAIVALREDDGDSAENSLYASFAAGGAPPKISDSSSEDGGGDEDDDDESKLSKIGKWWTSWPLLMRALAIAAVAYLCIKSVRTGYSREEARIARESGGR